MREALWKPLSVIRLLALGTLVAMILVGCAQNENGNGQPPNEQTAVTETDMTEQETTADVGDLGNTTQRTQDGDRGDTTTQEQGQTQQQESAREERPSDQQGEQQTITVRITGSEGLAFAGRVGTAQDRQRVQGSVPEEYKIPFEGDAVTAAVRKQEPQEGTLGVEVVREGQVVASTETSSATGVVNVVWTPQEEPGNRGG